MRRFGIVLVVACCLSCCGEETKRLAQATHIVQTRQGAVVKRLADFALGRNIITQQEHDRIMGNQKALIVSTRSLSEIIGEPEDPVEVDRWSP